MSTTFQHLKFPIIKAAFSFIIGVVIGFFSIPMWLPIAYIIWLIWDNEYVAKTIQKVA